MTFVFLPCLVACEISAPDQGSNLVSSESARTLTSGLPGNSQMILGLISPRCLFFCKNYVQDRVYLPPPPPTQVTELQTGEAVHRFLIAFLLDPSPLAKCLQFLHLALEMSL